MRRTRNDAHSRLPVSDSFETDATGVPAARFRPDPIWWADVVS